MRRRSIGTVALGLCSGIAVLLWLTARPDPTTPSSGVVVVDAAPPPAPASAPAPPPAPRTVAAAPDAFVGSWRSPQDARLVIARVADRYAVKLTIDGSSEDYDGVLQDGRVQIARGIDGEWIQILAGSGPPCLQLGTTQVFCRT